MNNKRQGHWEQQQKKIPKKNSMNFLNKIYMNKEFNLFNMFISSINCSN